MFKYNAYSEWSTEILTTTSAAVFVPLGDFPCDEVVIYNPSTGVQLDILASSKIVSDPTKFVTIDVPSGAVIPVGANASEIAVRRTDLAATSTTIRFIWRKFRR